MRKGFLAVLALLGLCSSASAQVDPERRRILHFGYDKPLSGGGPTGLYLFFYSNQPDWIRKGINFRLALAPVYADGELGFKGVVSENTDMAMGLAGGGFADSYNEVRQGHYHREESFTGHGVGYSMSVYHLFNPGQRVPLYGVARLGSRFMVFERRGETRSDFQLPPDRLEGVVRVGLRLGGEPPELLPKQAAELSFWYEGRSRTHARHYGLNEDRTVQSYTALAWTRLRGAFRTESGRRYELAATAGTAGAVDRFSAYRLGGQLPFSSEFPLALPGYYNGELSARRFALFSGVFGLPLDPKKIVSARLFAASANVSFLPGMEQPKAWNSSVGSSLAIEIPKGLWRLELAYGYGIDALRHRGRGAHNVTLLTQIDFDAMRGPVKHRPLTAPIDWVFQLFRP